MHIFCKRLAVKSSLPHFFVAALKNWGAKAQSWCWRLSQIPTFVHLVFQIVFRIKAFLFQSLCLRLRSSEEEKYHFRNSGDQKERRYGVAQWRHSHVALGRYLSPGVPGVRRDENADVGAGELSSNHTWVQRTSITSQLSQLFQVTNQISAAFGKSYSSDKKEDRDWHGTDLISLSRPGTTKRLQGWLVAPADMMRGKQQLESAHLTWCYYDSWSRVFADNVSWSVRILRHVEVQMQGTLRLRGRGNKIKKTRNVKVDFQSFVKISLCDVNYVAEGSKESLHGCTGENKNRNSWIEMSW